MSGSQPQQYDLVSSVQHDDLVSSVPQDNLVSSFYHDDLVGSVKLVVAARFVVLDISGTVSFVGRT